MTNNNDGTARGCLTIVGSGITAISHLTQEAISQIRSADIVFYHMTNGVAASHLRTLNANAVDLYALYGEGKIRRVTYVQMAELMLRELRRGKRVVGVFYGHPAFFVSAARRALFVATKEGYDTSLMPGISSIDCLFADLKIDPGVSGLQVLKASRILREDAVIAVSGHLVLVQAGALGDRTFSFSGYKNRTLEPLFEKLISVYGEAQESIHYIAATFPGTRSEITVRRLAEYRSPSVIRMFGSPLLYLPPRGTDLVSVARRQAFHGTEPYGSFEARAISELGQIEIPPGFPLRRASTALLSAMTELATDATANSLFRRSAAEFVKLHPDLSAAERNALVSGQSRWLREVTTSRPIEESRLFQQTRNEPTE
jgi:precorrin-2 methylase